VGQVANFKMENLYISFVSNYYRKLYKESILSNNNSLSGSNLLKIAVPVMMWVIIPPTLKSCFTDINFNASFQAPFSSKS
jgi:hypothetical protein